MKVIISTYSELPIYSQIKEQIKEQIMSGLIPENTTLPSIRQLARDLGVSVITTTKAYNELEIEGFILPKQGKGCIVLPRDNNVIKEQYLKKIEEYFEIAISNAYSCNIENDELIMILKNLLKNKE